MVIVVHFVTDEAVALELRFQKHREKLDLLVRQLRVPKVDDKVDPSGLPIVPGLMVERVIEDYAPVLL